MTAPALNEQALGDIVQAMGLFPEDAWDVGDDLCDCTYQRIGLWKNIYLAETLEVRMCCIWSKLYELFPQYVRTTPGYMVDSGEWITECREWDGETDMPKGIWYRQLARQQGRAVADIRREYSTRDSERPKGTPRPPLPEVEAFDPIEALFEMVQGLAAEVAALRGERDAAGHAVD